MGRKRHITIPRGFAAAGVKCGIKTSGEEDLAILTAEKDVPAAILTTRNQVVGAPITWCRRILPRGHGRLRAIVVNSGNSNVCTGAGGIRDAEAMAARTARALGTSRENVLVASTGVIGHALPMGKIRSGIDAAAARVAKTNDAPVLRAIMTTDTRAKFAVIRSRFGRTAFTVAGIAKGSGMIAPSMATMISLITTDLSVTPTALHKALSAAARVSFNTITIDSDTSTSDIVAAFASGAVGNRAITGRSPDFRKFASVLTNLCCDLARQIVADGEGATKLIEVKVRGARSGTDAELAARSVANSPLFKCAINGADPNWGRIAMALGKSPARIAPEKLTIRIGGVTIFSRGTGRKFDTRRVRKHLAGDEVEIACDLGLGRGQFTALTCDFSREYVTINADYHT